MIWYDEKSQTIEDLVTLASENGSKWAYTDLLMK
jgi:hypothetical protein